MMAQSRVVSKNGVPNFTLFDPCKIRGGVGENAEWDDQVDPMTEPVIYLCAL